MSLEKFENGGKGLRYRGSSIMMAGLLVGLVGLLFPSQACQRRHSLPALTDVTEETPNPLPDLKKAAVAGKKLFLTNCAICHGHEGLGDGPSRSSLIAEPANLTAPPVADYRDGRMFLSIKLGKMVKGRLTMPPVSKMTDEEIWQTIAYVRTLSGRP